jgi:hypothetical protein
MDDMAPGDANLAQGMHYYDIELQFLVNFIWAQG